MNNNRQEVNQGVNKLLDRLLAGLKECNELRYQLLVDLQFHLENIDRINNTLTYKEKVTQEQVEKNIAFQKKENQILAWTYEAEEQMKIADELFIYAQRYYDSLKKTQDDDLLALTESIKGKKLLEQIEEIKKAQQRYIQMLFDTIKEYQKQAEFLTQKIILIDEKIALSKERVASLQIEITEIGNKINKCKERIIILDKIIENIDKEFNRNEERILVLDKRIDQLGKKEEELLQERHQIIEEAFVYTDKLLKINLLMIQGSNDRLIEPIKVDLVRQGITMIEIHHADIIKDLKIILAKKEKIDNAVVEIETNNIVRKFIEAHCKEFLSEDNVTYFIKELTGDAYYKKEVEKMISEIINSQDLNHDLNNNLITINSVRTERAESEKERAQLSETQDQLKEDRSQASSDKEKVIKEQDSLKEDQSRKEKEQENEIEKQNVLKQERGEMVSQLDQVVAIKSTTCEQLKQQAETHQEVYTNMDKVKAEQDKVKAEKQKEINSRNEKLRQLIKAREAKKSADATPKQSSSSGLKFFSEDRASVKDNKEHTVNSKEKVMTDKSSQSDNNQDASNDPSFSENRGKGLK